MNSIASVRIPTLEITTETETILITTGKTMLTRTILDHPTNPLPAGSPISIDSIMVEQTPQFADQGVLISIQFIIVGTYKSQQINLPPAAFVPASSLVIA